LYEKISETVSCFNRIKKQTLPVFSKATKAVETKLNGQNLVVPMVRYERIFEHFLNLCVTHVIDAYEETDTVATPSDIRMNQLTQLSESLARFKAPRHRQRKRRTIFSPAATRLLQHEFITDCYPDNGRLQQLAQLIGHTDIAAIQVSLGLYVNIHI